MPPIDDEHPLLLASASPRRRELLENVGLAVRVQPVNVDEAALSAEGPEQYLERVVESKLRAALGRPWPAASGALLVADTTVIADDAILGKPADTGEAESMLRRLVGRSHWVKTRYAICHRGTGASTVTRRTVETEVRMRPATDVEVRRYAETGEGLDKAGAYAIQGIGSFLVAEIRGSYTNVVGLPVCEVIADLAALGHLGRFPP